jgi:diaminopropionate ammonia-lyase
MGEDRRVAEGTRLPYRAMVYRQRVDLDGALDAVEATLPYDGYIDANDVITSWHDYAPTPLLELRDLAARLGLRQVLLKDESARFRLGSFKALGGAYAVSRVVREQGHDARAGQLTVTCSSAGNHGASIAWGAQRFGCRCVIYVHKGVDELRRRAIRRLGAEVVCAGDTYDESVQLNADDAERNGWTVVSDTNPHAVTSNVVAIMQGYRVLAEEVFNARPARPTPSHLFLQVGCGGFAAAIASHFLQRSQADSPTIVGVEPETAACLATSLAAGRSTKVGGPLETVMTRLAVGEMSKAAWGILSCVTKGVVTIPDESALAAIETLPTLGDGADTVVAGEAGVAGLAGLMAVAAEESARSALQLSDDSRVLIVNTEGLPPWS